MVQVEGLRVFGFEGFKGFQDFQGSFWQLHLLIWALSCETLTYP